MPSLPRNPHESADSVRAYLEDVLPDSQLADARVQSGYEPLLLLRTKHVMAAFAFSNGDMRKSYEDLYGGFKRYYSEQQGRWDNLDLAFVFCVRPDVPNLDRFCSNLETDVYFCRKFVVPLRSPLDASLARLPFLPLTPLHGQSMRPPSAQTFLQQCGVPPMLAKFLVVQRERSPEGIVEDCMDGRFGEPVELTPALNAPVAHIDRVLAPVRLDSVVIKDFRAYRKSQTFDLGADVTILYGPNGFGKTSFFDAIDFAVTGEIGRIKSSGDAHFNKTAKHLDSKAEESVVSLFVSSGGAVRKVTRRVSDRKQALLDGRTTDRKAILAELTGGDIPATDRVENFVSLFRATHLFSQEHQELTKDFERDCELSEQIVSHLLAFEDYANAVNKASKVREIAQTTVEAADKEIRDLSEQIVDEKLELDRLGRTARAHTPTGALDDVIESLRRKVREAGISVPPEESDLAMVRGMRASIEARNSESQARIARLSGLAKDAVAMPGATAELGRLREQLSQKEQALDTVDKKRLAAEQELQRAQQKLSEITARRSAAQTRAAILEWVRTTQPRYADILERQRGINEELKRATTMLTNARESEAKVAGELRTQERDTNQATDELTRKRNELTVVLALNEAVTSWQANHARRSVVGEAEQASLKSLESLGVEERDIASQLAEVVAEEARLTRQIAEVDRNQSELRKLLSQLQGHVRSGTCPLCGENHGTKDELLSRIQKQVAADAASGARTDLARVQEKAKRLSERVAICKETKDRTTANLASLRTERSKLAEEIEKFEDAVGKLGIAVELVGQTTMQQLQSRYQQLQQESADLNRQVQERTFKIQGARTALADLRSRMAATTAELAEKETALADLLAQANRFREDPRFAQFPLDIQPEQLAEHEHGNLQELAELNTHIANAEVAVSHSTSQVDSIRHESISLKAELPALRNEIATVQKTVTEVSGRFEESKLSPDAGEATVLAMVAQESRAQAQFVELRELATGIEMAIDTATTAAALTRLRQNVVNKERAVTIATAKREQHRPWMKYFDALSVLVSSQQNEAIAHFTREYGPRTSVIQRRLRSVYGFDEVEIHSHESTIRVRVKRRGEELRPTDYFSQSQQQTLLLGLFLTACLSQTWSALAPVFLDDPVTHFDDLNTYAFLDLIVGLLESDSGQRQFIISTCDEKFLQLARQKFRQLGERARFYTFSAIGADGPVIGEIKQPPPAGPGSASSPTSKSRLG
jgi:exonuclease SbcC